jgi:hypothetical protein
MRNLSVIKGLYQGNGVTRRWAIPFEYNDTAQIFVTITTYDEGDYTYRVLDRTEYTIDEDSVEIVYPKTDDDAPIPSTQYLTVWRDTDLLQLMDLTNQGAAWPDSIEASLDKLHQIVQELAEGLSRSLKVDIGDPQTPDEKLVAIQDYVLAAAESSRSASASEASAQRAAEAAATSETNAAESERNAEGWSEVASINAGKAEQAAVGAQAYNAPAWESDKEYMAGDVVTYIDGSSYRAIADNTGIIPTNTTYWTKITSYVGDDYWILDAAGYIVPNPNPTYSGRWEYDSAGYLVPINNQIA